VSADEAPSIALVEVVYGVVAADDPAETFHEASRLAPSTALAQLPGLQLLQQEPALRASVERAGRRHRHRPGVELGPPQPLRARLDRALARRRSALPPQRLPLELCQVSALLAAAQGAHRAGDRWLRAAPSGGALYPLELYPLVFDVTGAARGAYHYDPYSHRLERLGPAPAGRVRAALVDETLLDRAALAVVVTSLFWRSRFKYGQRGYRFALLEAGHAVQNLLLAAAAMRLPALPLGGFYDARVEALVGADGVDEGALYVVLVGGAA
jgi:SagB-type dehydrogenase family enzyme